MPSCVESRFSRRNSWGSKSCKKKRLLQFTIHVPPSKIPVGVELVVFDRLDGDGGGGAKDRFFVDRPRDLGGGAGEAEDELAVVSGASDMLQEFERDVCGVEVGED